MRIIYVTSANLFKGYDEMPLDLCVEMRRRGASVTALTRNKREMTTLFREAGVDLITAPQWGAFDPFSPARLARAIRRSPEGTVIIHTFNHRDTLLAQRARMLAERPDVKIVMSYGSVAAYPSDESRNDGVITNDIDLIIAPCESALEGLNLGNSTVKIIPPAAWLKPSEDTPIAKDTATVQLLVCGDITPNLQLDSLMDALAEIKHLPWQLTVVGEGSGPVVMPIIRRSRDLGIADRIDWRGNDRRMAKYTDHADIAICPGKQDASTLNPLLLYLAAGLPAVVNKSLPISQLAETIEGVEIYNDEMPGELSAILTGLITDSERKRSQTPISFDEYVSAIEETYRSIQA